MGILDGLLGLLGGSQAKVAPQPQQQEPATAPVSSAPDQAQVPLQPQLQEQQQVEAMSANAKMITTGEAQSTQVRDAENNMLSTQTTSRLLGSLAS